MKSFDPQQLDNRWHKSAASRSLLHPSLQGGAFDGNLGELAKSLIEGITREAQGLKIKEHLGEERLAIVMALIDSLAVAVAREAKAWQVQTLKDELELPDAANDLALEPEAESEEILEVDEFERIAADLEGILELYLQDSKQT